MNADCRLYRNLRGLEKRFGFFTGMILGLLWVFVVTAVYLALVPFAVMAVFILAAFGKMDLYITPKE